MFEPAAASGNAPLIVTFTFLVFSACRTRSCIIPYYECHVLSILAILKYDFCINLRRTKNSTDVTSYSVPEIEIGNYFSHKIRRKIHTITGGCE